MRAVSARAEALARLEVGVGGAFVDDGQHLHHLRAAHAGELSDRITKGITTRNS